MPAATRRWMHWSSCTHGSKPTSKRTLSRNELKNALRFRKSGEGRTFHTNPRRHATNAARLNLRYGLFTVSPIATYFRGKKHSLRLAAAFVTCLACATKVQRCELVRARLESADRIELQFQIHHSFYKPRAAHSLPYHPLLVGHSRSIEGQRGGDG